MCDSILAIHTHEALILNFPELKTVIARGLTPTDSQALETAGFSVDVEATDGHGLQSVSFNAGSPDKSLAVDVFFLPKEGNLIIRALDSGDSIEDAIEFVSDGQEMEVELERIWHDELSLSGYGVSPGESIPGSELLGEAKEALVRLRNYLVLGHFEHRATPEVGEVSHGVV